MRVTGEAREFESNMPISGQSFQIKASAKAFKILSDQLYQKKELAIVRELTANAWDAHVCAKTTDTPIKIHMPTSLESWFEITDYGTGLSDAHIHSLYTTYFASNKNDSDDLIGGFGLGSKSPFAYCDQFTVVSRHDRVRREYQVFIGTDGVPTIMRINEMPTTEGPGLTVRVPVNMSHIPAFRDAGNEIFPFLPTPPNVNLAFTPVEFAMEDTTADGMRYTMVKQLSYGSGHAGKFYVVQGNVRYPVEFETLHLRDRDRIPTGTHLFVPIGTLEVSASREALSMDDTTKSTLIKLHNDVLADYFEKATVAMKAVVPDGKLALWDKYRDLIHSGIALNATNPTAQAIREQFDFDVPALPDTALFYVSAPSYRGKKLRNFSFDPHAKWNDDRTVKIGDFYGTQYLERRIRGEVYWLDTLRPYMHFFEDGTGKQEALIIRGTEADRDAYIKELGLDPTKVIPIPKAPPRVKGQAKKYGSALYTLLRSDNTSLRLTANQLINGEMKPKAFISKYGIQHWMLEQLNHLAQHKIIDISNLQFVDVTSGHTKVYEALLEAGAIAAPQSVDAAVIALGYDLNALLTASEFTSSKFQIDDAKMKVWNFLPRNTAYDALCPEFMELRAHYDALCRPQHCIGLHHLNDIITKALDADPTATATAKAAINTMCNEPIKLTEQMAAKYGDWISGTADLTYHLSVAQSDLMQRVIAQANNP